jgi:hypothetical protein
MPESKQAPKSAPKDLYQQALERGYFGESPKTIPNEEFSLKTGPDSPSAAAQIVDARRGQLVTAEASLTKREGLSRWPTTTSSSAATSPR